MSDTERPDTAGRQIKVVRLLDEYGLDELGDQMEQRWTATGDERMSLRDLADYFNRELLRTALSEAGAQPLDGEIENIYRLLTADDLTDADGIRAQRRLEREGVDATQLQRDFVTYQAIRTYLKDHRDASYTANTRARTEAEQESIQRLRGRMLTVTDSKLEQLKQNDNLDLGEYRTLVDINVLCEDCDTQYGIDELLDRGGCNCNDPDVS
jgi:hypothetical protein